MTTRTIRLEAPEDKEQPFAPVAAPVAMPALPIGGQNQVMGGQVPQVMGGQAGQPGTQGGRGQNPTFEEEPFYEAPIVDEGYAETPYQRAMRLRQEAAAKAAAARRMPTGVQAIPRPVNAPVVTAMPKGVKDLANMTTDVWGYISAVRDKIPFSPSGSTQPVDLSFNKRTGTIMMRLSLAATNASGAPVVFRPWNFFRRIVLQTADEKREKHIDVEDGITLAMGAANVYATRYPSQKYDFIQQGVAEETVNDGATVAASWWMFVPGPFALDQAKMIFETYSLLDMGLSSVTLELDVYLLDGALGRGRKPLKYVGFRKTAAATIGVENARSVVLYRPEGSQVWNNDLKINLDGKESLGVAHVAAFSRLYLDTGIDSVTTTDLIHMAFPGETNPRVELAVSNVAADVLYISGVSDVADKPVTRTAFENYDLAVMDPDTGELLGIIPQE